MTVIDWQSLQDNDINIFANNINTAIISLAAECIPNRYIKIKPLEPPWITSFLKRHIRSVNGLTERQRELTVNYIGKFSRNYGTEL